MTTGGRATRTTNYDPASKLGPSEGQRRICVNKRVLGGIAVVALAVLAVSPRLLGALAPVLLMAICPLSMVFMMRGAHGPRDGHGSRSDDRQLRELEEEVNRLKAELALRGRDRPS